MNPPLVTESFRIKGRQLLTEKLLKFIESPKFVSRKARILGEFDLRKNLQPTKLE